MNSYVLGLTVELVSKGKTATDFLNQFSNGGKPVGTISVVHGSVPTLLNHPQFKASVTRDVRYSIRTMEMTGEFLPFVVAHQAKLKHGFVPPPIEVAPLFCEWLFEQKIDLRDKRFLFMHEPVENDGAPQILCAWTDGEDVYLFVQNIFADCPLENSVLVFIQG